MMVDYADSFQPLLPEELAEVEYDWELEEYMVKEVGDFYGQQFFE